MRLRNLSDIFTQRNLPYFFVALFVLAMQFASGLVSTVCVFSVLIAARALFDVSPSHVAAETLAMCFSRRRSGAPR